MDQSLGVLGALATLAVIYMTLTNPQFIADNPIILAYPIWASIKTSLLDLTSK